MESRRGEGRAGDGFVLHVRGGISWSGEMPEGGEPERQPVGAGRKPDKGKINQKDATVQTAGGISRHISHSEGECLQPIGI